MNNGSRKRCAGFAYMLLLASVAIVAIAATASLQIGTQVSRKDAERHLLFVGFEFERALISYAAFSSTGPRTLEDLLKDPRAPGVRRHLRQIYADPLTGQSTWGLTKDPAGFIVGVYSLAQGKPIQQTGFKPHQKNFEEAQSYGDWVFGLPQLQQPPLQPLQPPPLQSPAAVLPNAVPLTQ